MKNPSQGLVFQDLVDCMNSYGNYFSFKEIFLLFQELDQEQNGNPNLDSFQEFFDKYKSD